MDTAVGGLLPRGVAMDLTQEHRVYGDGPTVEAEVERVQGVGGWVTDGRVCDMIAVSQSLRRP